MKQQLMPPITLACAFALGLAAVHCVHADPPKNAPDTPLDTDTSEAKPTAPLPGDPGSTPSGGGPITGLLPDGISWGMSHTQVTDVYNKTDGIFDRDYQPLLAKEQPGIKMQQIEADRDNHKAAFARSWIRFLDTPTGYDTSGIKGEFTYKNEESVQVLDRNGMRRYYFYIGTPPNERLWKTYEEVALKDGGTLGGSFKDAAIKLSTKLGQAGKLVKQDNAKGVLHDQVEWADGGTHMRLVDRSGEKIAAIVLEDKGTLNNIDALRKNKPTDPFALDPTIANITKQGVSDPNNPNASPSASPSASAKPKKK